MHTVFGSFCSKRFFLPAAPPPWEAGETHQGSSPNLFFLWPPPPLVFCRAGACGFWARSRGATGRWALGQGGGPPQNKNMKYMIVESSTDIRIIAHHFIQMLRGNIPSDSESSESVTTTAKPKGIVESKKEEKQHSEDYTLLYVAAGVAVLLTVCTGFCFLKSWTKQRAKNREKHEIISK